MEQADWLKGWNANGPFHGMQFAVCCALFDTAKNIVVRDKPLTIMGF